MKASVEWLNEYADIDVSAKELGDILTMTGSKVETIDDKSEEIKNVVVGKILEVKKHKSSAIIALSEGIRNADGQGRALRPVPHSRQRSAVRDRL